MSPPISISLVLQPPSCHTILSLSSSSRARNSSSCSFLNTATSFSSSTSAPTTVTPTTPTTPPTRQHTTITSTSRSTDTPLFLSSGTTTASSAALVRSPLARSFSFTADLSSFSSTSSITTPHSTESDASASSDPSSVIWKAYSRVKQTITDNQPKPLETMSEYWYSLSTPRPQDLLLQESQQPQQEASISKETPLCVNTSSFFHSTASSSLSPSSSSSSSSISSNSTLQSLISEVDSDSTSPCSDIKPSPVSALSSPTSVSLNTDSLQATSTDTSSSSGSPSSSSSTSAMPRISLPTQAYNYYAASTLQTTTLVRSASEQGRLLAQRSKTSLNRLLDTVMDNATSLAESSAAHESYSEGDEEEKHQVKKTSPTTTTTTTTTATTTTKTVSRRPVLQRQITSRAKFFVCEDSDEDEDEDDAAEEALFRSRIAMARRNNCSTSTSNIKQHQQAQKSNLPPKFYVEVEDELDGVDGDNEQDDQGEDDEEEEEESYFSPKAPENLPVVERRRKSSSLLSDLLMAEKQLQIQQLSMTLATSPGTRNSTDMDCFSCNSNHESVPGSPCPSTTNSDGEVAIFHNGRGLFRTTSSSKHLDRFQHQQQQSNEVPPPPSPAAFMTEGRKPKSPLVRTKKVFSNLDGLAVITATTDNVTPSSNCTVSTPISVSPSSPLSPTASSKAPATTTTTTPNPSAGWTRASLQVQQQVQVQIQNLVVQSTSTAHRAFRSASSTLNEVLFRTAK